MEDANIKLLELVHEQLGISKHSREYLMSLIENPITPPAMREEFAKIHTNIVYLAEMLKGSIEHNMEISDMLEKLIEKHSPKS